MSKGLYWKNRIENEGQSNTDFKVFLLKKGQSLELPRGMIQLRPTGLYVFPEGSVTNEMSFALELSVDDKTPVVLAQISARMLLEALPKELLDKLKEHLTGGIN